MKVLNYLLGFIHRYKHSVSTWNPKGYCKAPVFILIIYTLLGFCRSTFLKVGFGFFKTSNNSQLCQIDTIKIGWIIRLINYHVTQHSFFFFSNIFIKQKDRSITNTPFNVL